MRSMSSVSESGDTESDETHSVVIWKIRLHSVKLTVSWRGNLWVYKKIYKAILILNSISDLCTGIYCRVVWLRNNQWCLKEDKKMDIDGHWWTRKTCPWPNSSFRLCTAKWTCAFCCHWLANGCQILRIQGLSC